MNVEIILTNSLLGGNRWQKFGITRKEEALVKAVALLLRVSYNHAPFLTFRDTARILRWRNVWVVLPATVWSTFSHHVAWGSFLLRETVLRV